MIWNMPAIFADMNYRPPGIPFRGKDRAPRMKKANAKQKPPSEQHGAQARRRRQIERGILNYENGLRCAEDLREAI